MSIRHRHETIFKRKVEVLKIVFYSTQMMSKYFLKILFIIE